MADAIRRLQQVTTVSAQASVHLIQLAERGCVSFEFRGGDIAPVTVVRQPGCTPASDLNGPERLVLEALFGTTLNQRSVTLAAYKFPNLDNRLRELAIEELRQKQYIEPSSLIPRLLLAVVAIMVIGGIAASLWSESKLAGCLLALLAVFALVVITKEPRGWRVSSLGARVIAQHKPQAHYGSLSEAVRSDRTDPLWLGFRSPQKPGWLSGTGLWSSGTAQNARTVALLVRSIDIATSQPPPPPKIATGQS